MAFTAWGTLDLALSDHGLAVGVYLWKSPPTPHPTQLLASRRLGEEKTWAKEFGLAL